MEAVKKKKNNTRPTKILPLRSMLRHPHAVLIRDVSDLAGRGETVDYSVAIGGKLYFVAIFP